MMIGVVAFESLFYKKYKIVHQDESELPFRAVKQRNGTIINTFKDKE